MDILLRNTPSREKEMFTPLVEGQVRMYSCGPTVYGRAHIGNLRSFILSDLLRRTFEYNGYDVTQVINITDVGHTLGDIDEGEDKMEHAARAQKKSAQEIAVYYTNLFFTDIGKLNILTSRTIFPRATAHINEQIALVKKLEEEGYTYTVEQGVYFDTSKFPRYADFAHLDIAGLKQGARISAEGKKNSTDFALWKFSSPDEKREQEWESPWGKGFPGWHLECSAMAMRYLGETFDVHTGGIDHISVHHTNEIAQSESATQKTFVRFWLHNEFITVEDSKMSKSLGNTYSLDDLSEKDILPLAFRYWTLTAHYRTPLNFTWDAVSGASQALERLYRIVALLPTSAGTPPPQYLHQFNEAISDDLDTPRAIAIMWALVHDDTISSVDKYAALIDFDRILGLDIKNAGIRLAELVHTVHINELPQAIQDLISKREEARKNKQWDIADEARKDLENSGYTVEDAEDGPKIRRK